MNNLHVIREILQQGGPNILHYISANIAYIGTTLTSLYTGNMWFHHIPKRKILIKDKGSILSFQNYINGLEYFFLLYVAQNDSFLNYFPFNSAI